MRCCDIMWCNAKPTQFNLAYSLYLAYTISSPTHSTQARQREAYLSYLEMLNKLQLFCAANSIVRTTARMYCYSYELLLVRANCDQ
jgi:hypothetical protein